MTCDRCLFHCHQGETYRYTLYIVTSCTEIMSNLLLLLLLLIMMRMMMMMIMTMNDNMQLLN